MDSFLKQIIVKSVMLEAFDAVLNRQFTAQEANANKTAKKLREYSFLAGSASDVESDLQAGLINVNSIFLSSSPSHIYSLSPTSINFKGYG